MAPCPSLDAGAARRTRRSDADRETPLPLPPADRRPADLLRSPPRARPRRGDLPWRGADRAPPRPPPRGDRAARRRSRHRAGERAGGRAGGAGAPAPPAHRPGGGAPPPPAPPPPPDHPGPPPPRPP